MCIFGTYLSFVKLKSWITMIVTRSEHDIKTCTHSQKKLSLCHELHQWYVDTSLQNLKFQSLLLFLTLLELTRITCKLLWTSLFPLTLSVHMIWMKGDTSSLEVKLVHALRITWPRLLLGPWCYFYSCYQYEPLILLFSSFSFSACHQVLIRYLS